MKRLFHLIGIFVALFSVLFFFYLADKKDTIERTENEYTFQLSKYITNTQLEKLAQKSDVTIQLKEFQNVSLGHTKMIVTFLNPGKDFKEGRRPSVFPKEKIIYQRSDQKKNQKVQFFSAVESNQKKIAKLKKLLKEEKFQVETDVTTPTPFGAVMLFNTLNAQFFVQIFLLAIFCIASYYVHRSKEIGILKLNGWNNVRISIRIFKMIFYHTIIPAIILMALFSIYILKMDQSMILTYLRLCIYISIFLSVVYGLALIAGSVFIHNIDVINAVKNKKNYEVHFYLTLLVKIVITVSVMINSSNLIDQINHTKRVIESARQQNQWNLSILNTSVSPSEKVQKRLNEIIGSLPDQDVYNYTSPEILYQTTDVSKTQRTDFIDNYMEISYNVLEKVKVVDKNNKRLKPKDFTGKAVLLIPQKYEKDQERILKELGMEKTDIYFIKDRQVYQDMLSPGCYAIDPIIYAHKVKKQLWLPTGEILYSSKGASVLNEAIEQEKIDQSTLYLNTLKSDNDVSVYNEQSRTLEAIFFVIMNISSYILCIVTITVIYLEFRKKEFGVYALYHRIPKKAILKFLCFNEVITLLSALMIEKEFLYFVLFEIVFCSLAIWKYFCRKAVLILKGE